MFKSLLLKGRTFCLLLCCMISSLVVTAQTKTGKVIGADDKLPVVGASIRIKGTNTGAVTDVNGDFTLSVASGNVLVVSYIGYVTKEVTVQSGQFITISLSAASSSLNEVVVTGYAVQKKKDITGAVGVVDVNDAKKVQATSSEQILQGQVSGVTVVNNGAPGSPSQVFVRGITNFGNTTPLYVIDGVQSNNMSQVNPTDIESISVLKDAGSAAIYGVAGGNGVIVVTTKKGKAGKTVLAYDAYYGDQVPPQGNVWHLMTPLQQAQLAYEAHDLGQASLYDPTDLQNFSSYSLPTYGYHGGTAFGAFGAAGVTNDPAIEKAYVFDAVNPANDFLVQKFNQQGTDWFHTIFKHAQEQSHTITASGGSEKNTFLYSLQYLNQTGTLLNTYEKRYQARVNNTYSAFGNKFRFGETGYVFYRDNNGGYGGNQQQEGGSIAETYRELPIIPQFDIKGNYGGGYDGPGGEPLGNANNPYAVQARQVNDRSKSWNIQGTAFAEADFLKYFTARTAFSGNANNFFYFYTGYNPYENYEPHTSPNNYTEVGGYSYNFNYTNSLRYHQVIGKHDITAFAAYEIKETGGQQLGVYATNFVTLDPNFLTVAATTVPTSIVLNSNTSIYQPTSTESVFGRVDYAYADKYLLGATIRRDGYSEFNPGRQWGTFPSVSVGWNIAQEDFMKSTSWLQQFKLRGSYGSTGSNANIGGTNAVNTYNYGFGNTAYGITGGSGSTSTGYAQTGIGNPKTTWETDKILNIGLDLSLFNHFDLTLEYYQKKISGLLFPVTLPSTVGGASSPTVNSGDVQNKGFDISAAYHGAVGNNFRFNASAYITTYKNKITAIPINGGYFETGGSRIGNLVRESVGQPIGEFYGYQVKGIYQNAAQVAASGDANASVGSYIYADINKDGKIDASDRTFIGNPNPNFTYGVNLNASYKGFDIATTLYGSQGNKDFNYVKYWTDTYHSFPGGKNVELLTKSATVDPATNTVTNPGATLQALSVSSTIPSTFYIENGSFLKMRVAQLGYTFASGPLGRVGISKLRVYVQGTNLFTITKYTGLDPELVPSISNQGTGINASAAQGIDYGAYPANQRVYSVGVNMTF